jgi:hypothetical protein
LQEVQTSKQPPRVTRLHIVHNSDRHEQEGKQNMKVQPPSNGPDRPKGMLDRSLQGRIGHMLRDIFSDVAEEPVPERFVKLLEALAAREKRR